MNKDPCNLRTLFERLPKCSRKDIPHCRKLRQIIQKRPDLFDLTSSDVVSSRLNEQELHSKRTKLLKKFMNMHLDPEHMIITNVGHENSRKMALFYKVNSCPLSIQNFVNDEDYFVVTDGINARTMVENLKIEEILMDFIVFLSNSSNGTSSIFNFNQSLTETECLQFGLSASQKQKNYGLLSAIFGLFPSLFVCSKPSKMSLVQDDTAFKVTLGIAAKVYNYSSLAVFNTLPNYCKAKFSDYEDFLNFFLNFKFKRDFRNHWKETQHSPDNSVIHAEKGRFYLLFRFEAFKHLNFEDIRNSPDFYVVPNVGFHIKPFINHLKLDQLLVKIIRLLLPTGSCDSRKIIDESAAFMWKNNGYPDTKNRTALIETIIELFPKVFCKYDSNITTLIDDTPGYKLSQERLILDILRAEEKVKPNSTKELFEALPDYVKNQFRSPLKLQEFCQGMVALNEEFSFLQEIETGVEVDEAYAGNDINDSKDDSSSDTKSTNSNNDKNSNVLFRFLRNPFQVFRGKTNSDSVSSDTLGDQSHLKKETPSCGQDFNGRERLVGLTSIQSELQRLASENINENSSEELRRFIRQLSVLSKKAETFAEQKIEELLCQELVPNDESIEGHHVTEI